MRRIPTSALRSCRPARASTIPRAMNSAAPHPMLIRRRSALSTVHRSIGMMRPGTRCICSNRFKRPATVRPYTPARPRIQTASQRRKVTARSSKRRVRSTVEGGRLRSAVLTRQCACRIAVRTDCALWPRSASSFDVGCAVSSVKHPSRTVKSGVRMRSVSDWLLVPMKCSACGVSRNAKCTMRVGGRRIRHTKRAGTCNSRIARRARSCRGRMGSTG